MKMSIKRFEIERVSVTSSMPFEAVVAALKDALGQLDLVEFAKVSKQAGTFTELKEVIDRNPGKTGLMLFLELDHGAVLRKETGLTTPKIERLVIGNPLVMKEMAKHVPEAGSYAPVTVLVDEQDGQPPGAIRQHGRYRRCSRSGFQSREPSSTRFLCSI